MWPWTMNPAKTPELFRNAVVRLVAAVVILLAVAWVLGKVYRALFGCAPVGLACW